MPRKPQRVESFGPEMMAVLLKGANDGLKVSMPYHKAIRFRQRLYQLRHAMQVESHPQYHIVARVRATITWDEGVIQTLRNMKQVPRPIDRKAPVTVEVTPLDSEFTSMLKDAGLDLTKTVSGMTVPDTDIEDFLDDITGKSKKSA